ncbi:hypothetical protein [Mycetocola zhujimingii]|uniref:hypothetical protein n=1 Tax=Mycetocola zhujimingii TaxID=2079792 RepID=UPI001E3406A7|nr:hypothetical protein [Mycetocola zhujimingii]
MTDEQRMQREHRMVRSEHYDPDLPDSVTANDLDRIARNELKTLTADNAERVARHLAMAAMLIEEDPELAHQHALSAARRAGRIGVVRETLAITAYETGDYALALRELRTHRRITGSNDQVPLMVDSERGVGRPERALELGRSVDRASLASPVRVALAIAMSGARLDLGQPELALAELQIPELNPDRAFEWSPELFAAEAEVLEELGRGEEAALWRKRAEVAGAAIAEQRGDNELETIEVFEILEESDDDDEDTDVTEPEGIPIAVDDSTDLASAVAAGAFDDVEAQHVESDAVESGADEAHESDDAERDVVESSDDEIDVDAADSVATDTDTDTEENEGVEPDESAAQPEK